MTGSAINTAHFLETAHLSTRATGAASLIQKLGQIGLDYHADTFLYRVVEMTVVAKLRDIKYRGRIPVKDGVTLYGIMDETGYLRENEIYVVSIRANAPAERRLYLTIMLDDRKCASWGPLRACSRQCCGHAKPDHASW